MSVFLLHKTVPPKTLVLQHFKGIHKELVAIDSKFLSTFALTYTKRTFESCFGNISKHISRSRLLFPPFHIICLPRIGAVLLSLRFCSQVLILILQVLMLVILRTCVINDSYFMTAALDKSPHSKMPLTMRCISACDLNI